MAGFLFLIGITGLIDVIGRAVPKAAIRGGQLSTGTLLMAEGTRLILGRSKFQLMGGSAEPYLNLQSIGSIPIGILIGILAGGIVMWFMNNRRFPAGLLVVVGGAVVGLFLGTHEGLPQLELGLNLPPWLPFGWPAHADWMTALFVLALPQLPMTVGNAVVADADLSREYFGQHSHRVTYRALTISMAIANLGSAVLGGVPLCHGAGGLAAHYRFGARTAGSNLIIGGIFIALGVLLGFHALAVGFVIGTAMAYALKSNRLDV